MVSHKVKPANLPNPVGTWLWLLGLASLTGVVAGLSAAALDWSLEKGIDAVIGRVAPLDVGEIFAFHPLVLILPAVGGLASALIVMWLCPTFTRQGANAMIRAFHRQRGELELRGPTVKAAASVVVISCGGSAGPESPIAALGAAIGSLCGKLFHVSPAQRRVLLIAGCASGIGAIFHCPLGGALFAISVLYSEPDYETDAIMPSLVASVMGHSTFMALLGQDKFLVRGCASLLFRSPLELVLFLALGVVCGLTAIFFGLSFRFVRWVKGVGRLPRWLWPAVGGLATGGLACFLPQVMDARYDFVRAIMDGSVFAGGAAHSWWWWTALFGALVLVKCMATACTIGSGGAGGALGPALAIGGFAGAALGAICEALVPGMFPEPLRQALIPVGMGGVLAASMRVPLAAIVMIVEMTGSYGLIVPIMLVCVTAYLIGRRWGLLDEQVPSSVESPIHTADVVVRLLESSRIGELVEVDGSPVVPPDTHLNQLVQQLKPGQQPAFMVVRDRRLLGVITVPDLAHVLCNSQLNRVVIAHDIMNEQTHALTPDRSLYDALEVFRNSQRAVLPVVSREPPHYFLGAVSRRTIFDTLVERIHSMKEIALGEHKGLLAIEEEARLDHLLMAVTNGHGPQVKRLMVPLEVLGKSIHESQFRSRYGLQIVAVEQPDGVIQSPPDLYVPLESSQRLLVISA